jgi:hypothetical protein
MDHPDLNDLAGGHAETERLLGLAAAGDLGAGPAVDEPLMEHLEVELRDLRGEVAEHPVHPGLPRATLADVDRPGSRVGERGPIVDRRRGAEAAAPEPGRRPVPGPADQPGREPAAAGSIVEIPPVGDHLAPHLLEAILLGGQLVSVHVCSAQVLRDLLCQAK